MGYIKTRSFDAILEPLTSLQFYSFFVWFIASYEDDHLTEEEQDVNGESVLDTQPKKQEHVDDNHSQTEDTEPEDFLYTQQQHHGTENKKPYGYTDDKPGLEKPNSMETQPSQQEDSHVKHMEIKQPEALESVGHNHYGSGREGQGMLDDEDSALYFRSTYTNAISQEDIALKHYLLNNNNTHKAPISILLFSSALKLKKITTTALSIHI